MFVINNNVGNQAIACKYHLDMLVTVHDKFMKKNIVLLVRTKIDHVQTTNHVNI